MARLTARVKGKIIDHLFEEGVVFVAGGLEIPFIPELYTEVILYDEEGLRSPIHCIVTGVKDNSDGKLVGMGQAAVRLEFGDFDEDEALGEIAVSGVAGMSTDIASVDAGTYIAPGSLTPAGACASTCQGALQPASYGPSCGSGCAATCQALSQTERPVGVPYGPCGHSCQTLQQGGARTIDTSCETTSEVRKRTSLVREFNSDSCALSCQMHIQVRQIAAICGTSCQADAEVNQGRMLQNTEACTRMCQTDSQVRQSQGSPAGLLKDKDMSGLTEGALWVWDRRFASLSGQRPGR